MVSHLLKIDSMRLLILLLNCCWVQMCIAVTDEPIDRLTSLEASAEQNLVADSEGADQLLAAYLLNPIVARYGVEKSEADQRKYRYIRLANKLNVLLISDEAAEKSAAALSVSVGANQNPRDREGLAHFLEHMLFLGTKKYPEPGEYQTFIAQHGGTYNAYTAAENTNYFFEIDNDQLEPALDRFAQFFIAPLFNADYVERERNAVHSEYVAKLKDDARREWDVYRELMNPLHPSAKFSVGNHATLGDEDGIGVRADLLSFYEQYYSAHLMNLVVIGREPLDQLEKVVASRFVRVAETNVHVDDKYPDIFPADFLPASLDIKPEKELRELSFNFPIPSPDHHLATKPYDYIAQILGHEGEGSLLSLLKRLGWAEGLNAGVNLQSRADALFQLSIHLTPRGVKARDQIVSLVFHTITQLENRGLNDWRYKELQQLAAMQFQFGEKKSPLQTVSGLAENMMRYPPKNVLNGDYNYESYNEDLLKKSLAYLNSNNLLLVLVAPEVEAYRVSGYYSVPFTLRKGVAEVLDLKTAVRQELYLPENNVFLPRRMHVKSQSMLEDAQTSKSYQLDVPPELILENANMQVWFKQDQYFSQPRAAINLRIYSPLVAVNAMGAAQAQLFAALIEDQLREYSYPAHLAGLDYRIEANTRGFELKIFGYSSRQSLLLNKLTEAIARAEFSEDRYELVKADLLRKWRNENKNLSFQVLAKSIAVLQFDPYWSNDDLIAALESSNYEQFNRFHARQLLDAKLEALFYGNYFKSEALKLAVFVEHELLERQTGRRKVQAKLLLLPALSNKPWMFIQPMDHSDQVVELYIQAGEISIAESAHMMLVQKLLQPLFFNELRTEKQLGYIVAAIPMPLKQLEASLLIVQSPTATRDQLIKEISELLLRHKNTIATAFAENQQSLIKTLREPARSLSEQSERYWDAILLGDKKFSRRIDLAVAITNATPDSVTDFYEMRFLNEKRRLWLVSAERKKKVVSDAIFENAPVDTDKFEVIKGIEVYKQQMNALIMP